MSTFLYHGVGSAGDYAAEECIRCGHTQRFHSDTLEYCFKCPVGNCLDFVEGTASELTLPTPPTVRDI